MHQILNLINLTVFADKIYKFLQIIYAQANIIKQLLFVKEELKTLILKM